MIKENVATTFAAKGLTCFETVKMGFDLGLSNVTIEGDLLSVIKNALLITQISQILVHIFEVSRGTLTVYEFFNLNT